MGEERKKPDDEIELLNADALDVEELERRLEMAVSMPDFGLYCGADCGSNCIANCGSNCQANCPGNCVANCTALCGVDGCGTDCGLDCGCNSTIPNLVDPGPCT
jgi:hypothetical protein